MPLVRKSIITIKMNYVEECHLDSSYAHAYDQTPTHICMTQTSPP